MKKNKFFKKILIFGLIFALIHYIITPLDINAAQVANPSSMNVGDYMRFNYTGGIQTFTAPKTGVYKLETYGAQGGNMSSGGKGGYATGTVTLTAGQTIYIVVGGAGAFNNTTKNHFAAGGYNGGGKGYEGSAGASARSHGGGGGATHIAFVSGTLSSIGYASAITNNNLLIVAGGGGGTGDWYTGSMSGGTGGLGGGLTGTSGYSNESTLGWSGSNQTAGNAFGQGGNASGSYLGEGGGGGGLYGGRSGGTHYYGGGGGSGYVSSSLLKSTNMSTGINLGNGYAIVTLSSLAGATLTLDNQGATTNGTTTVATTLGSVLPSITVPTKVGYTFNGYYESVNGNGIQYYSGLGISNFIANSSVDKTVYAQWIPSSNTLYTVNHYQMELNGADYSLIESETLFGTTDSFVIPNTKNYTGFTSPVTQEIVVQADGTSTLNYYYTRNQYSISLIKGVGIQSIVGDGSYYYGQSVTINAILLPEYNFQDWTGYEQFLSPEKTFFMPDRNITLTANAFPNIYNITYELNGGIANNPSDYTIASNFILTNPIKENHVFIGWTGSNGEQPQMIVEISNNIGNLSYYANYRLDCDIFGHTESDWIIDFLPTCTENGLQHTICTTCGEIVRTEEILALGHQWDDGVITIEATCDLDGLKTYTCMICGETYTEVIPKIGVHNYDNGIVTINPTCTDVGQMTYTCLDCGTFYHVTIPALSHDYIKSITKDATCEETGIATYTCSRCGDIYTEIIPLLEHQYTNILTPATCTELGTNVFTCSVCQTSYTEILPALGHSLDSGIITTEATCDTNGIKTYTCQHDNSHIELEVIPMLGHQWDDGVITIEPGCETTGEKVFTCSVCQEQKIEILNELGHIPSEWIIDKEATILESGKRHKECLICGEILEEEILEPLGYTPNTPSYYVAIPKILVLDGETGLGEYTVSVTGDISTESEISVIPPDLFTMYSRNKEDVLTFINQTNTIFKYRTGVFVDNWQSETGIIKMSSISAGKWNGSFNFTIIVNLQ